MNLEMTGKERVLAALQGQDCDRLCWAPLIDHYFTASLPEQGCPELDVPGACRLVGADIIERHSQTLHTVYDDVIRHRVQHRGEHDTEIFETPVGTLRSERGFTRGSSHVIRWPVQTVADVKTWQYVMEHTHSVENYAVFEQRQALIGDDGIATSSGPMTPITVFLEDLCGVANTYFLLADHPAEVEACFDTIHARNLALYRLLAESPGKVIIDYEDTSSTLISPAFYRRFCAPYIDEYARLCHAAGKMFITHMCGKLTKFGPQLQAGLQDGIDSVCPPTTGDLWAHDARQAWGPDKIILGGIEPASLERMTAEETRVYVTNILKCMPTFRRFILSTGDATAFGTPVANLRAITKVVRAFAWK